MTKGKKRLVAVISIVAILLGIVTCCGVALSVNDKLFQNNTPTYMSLGTSLKGKITARDDYDAYIVEIPADGVFTVCLEHEDFDDYAKSGWVVTLYKVLSQTGSTAHDYKEIAYFESFWADVTSDWDKVGVSAGTYCIMVEPSAYFLEVDYTISTLFEQSDTYEREPNDTEATATPLAVGYGKHGNTSNRQEGTDIDWYAFDVRVDSCVNISFTHPDGTSPTVGWVVTLQNEQGQKITQFTSRLFKDDMAIKTGKIGLKEGRYYISVEAQTDMADEYSIVLGSEKANNFEFEMNDSPETAISLPHGVVMSGSLADRLLSLDKDYYKFTVEGEGYIDLTFSHALQTGDKNGWNVRILKELADGSYCEIIKRISKWNSETMELKNIGLPAGDYYLLVDGDSVSYNSTTYSVKWRFTAAENYEREPNSSFLNCQTIEFRTTYSGAIMSSADMVFDEDYYRFTVNSTKTVGVEFSHEIASSSDVCWNVSIIDDKGKVYAEIKSPLNQEIVLTDIVELPAGVYFIKVETGDYGSEMPYKIRLSG